MPFWRRGVLLYCEVRCETFSIVVGVVAFGGVVFVVAETMY